MILFILSKCINIEPQKSKFVSSRGENLVMPECENKLNFKFVQKSQLPLVKKWLSQPYIAKWIHGNGLDNTYKGLDKFLAGVTEPTQYWISYCDKEAFGFLITSKLNKSDSILEGVPLVGDEIFGLDIFICKESYLGKGFGKKMIKEILQQKFSHATDFIIDPEQKNKRAVYVYEKVGFKIIKKFIAPWHPVPHYLMHMERSALEVSKPDEKR